MSTFQPDDRLYDWISCLLPDHLYFGPFPNQVMIDNLANEGFTVILNLTIPGEETMYYLPEGIEYLAYPIPDNRFPLWIASYARMVTKLKYRCLTDKVYVHCRGGHGRSGMTCVSIIYSLLPYDLRTSIAFVNQSHNDRGVLRNKWRKRNSPFNYDQFTFLSRIHKNIYVNIDRPNKYYHWLYPRLPDPLHEVTDFVQLYRELEQWFEHFPFQQKLQQTHLKKFVLADCTDPIFCQWYGTVVWYIREFLFYFF